MAEFKLNFSGIGAAKAGTTWIARCLGEHPAVCMARGKETNFFLKNHIAAGWPARQYRYGSSHHNDGFEWLKGRFAHYEPGQLCGEFSNAYLTDPHSAELLYAHNPEIKLLCCFRNPVDSAYALFHEVSRVRPLPVSFEESVAAYPPLLQYGRYHLHLPPFLKRFPRERIHFMLFDDIKSDPVDLYRSLCDFLELDSSVVPETVARRVNPRTVLRSRAVRNLRSTIDDFLMRTPTTRKLRTALARAGVAGLATRVFSLNEKPGAVPPMNPETRRRLVEFYREDTEAVQDLLDRDLSHWTQVA